MSRTTVTTIIPELDDPMIVVGQWLDEAVSDALQPNPNAMTLATAGSDGRPSARVVLVKALERQQGYAEFYTNYGSRKASDLRENGWAAGVMHWDASGRQLRFEGPVLKSPDEDSDRYFASRPWRSQINACASRQSRPLTGPTDLERAAQRLAQGYGAPDPFGTAEPTQALSIPRPHFWGGYRFWFAAIEIWASGRDRFHERVRFDRDLRAKDEFTFAAGSWSHTRLQP
jgi:pyridoxamine 5'-phosphate oxidase